MTLLIHKRVYYDSVGNLILLCCLFVVLCYVTSLLWSLAFVLWSYS